MIFKIGDKVRRRTEHQTSWWKGVCKYSVGISPDIILTVSSVCHEGLFIIFNEINMYGSFKADKFELVSTGNKRLARELD